MLKIVKTENGLVRGLPAADPRVISFKGIPFAAPPVGRASLEGAAACGGLGRGAGLPGICAHFHAEYSGAG